MDLSPENFTKEAISNRHKQLLDQAVDKSTEARVIEFLKGKPFSISGLLFPSPGERIKLTLEMQFSNSKEYVFESEKITSILIDAHGGIS
ncbi:hypothetical protein FH587_19050 [Leptospira interrogans]|uniref:hypothetical protein n=1 Tax=Leptospira interrogans TaxID=173 RepID=UPI001F07AE53|nr:hypothetical protein [Leptospira interrogans]UML84102.1 hypothetical protein FH587_19050 [Leptospira interrogans]